MEIYVSRWSDNFNNHAFHKQWSRFKNLSDKVVLTDETVQTDVEELARLRKVTSYVDELLSAADAELLPQNIWNDFNNQAQNCVNQLNAYVGNRNIVHMQNVNNHLDNILSYIRPYVVSGKNAAQAAGKAFKVYSDTITEQMERIKSHTQSMIQEIQQIRSNATVLYREIEESKQSIKTFEKYLFQGTTEEKSFEGHIKALFNQVKEQHTVISNYYQGLTKGNEHESAIILQIDEAKAKALKSCDAITASLEAAQEGINDLESFHVTVFGEEEENGSTKGGLKQELKSRISELEAFKKRQQEAYSALITEIESLLAGATSAGLATAYKGLKDDSEKQVKHYTKIFYGALAILTAMAGYLVTHKVGWFYIEFIDIIDPIMWLHKFMYKLPLLGPVLWLAYFSSKRRSEFQRLQQEYAHKEALATSYHSFKKQIEELNESDSVLMKQLLESAIKAISFNAAKTLDGKHGEKAPFHEAFENTLGKIKDSIANA